jgi:hypothetical protein
VQQAQHLQEIGVPKRRDSGSMKLCASYQVRCRQTDLFFRITNFLNLKADILMI